MVTRLIFIFMGTYYFLWQFCYSYRQIARQRSFEPIYQYPIEPEHQGEHFILYPGKYDITLRRPGLRRHRHRKQFINYPFYTWEQERNLHEPVKRYNFDVTNSINDDKNSTRKVDTTTSNTANTDIVKQS
ncbi:hypothetical protein ILUMI_01626 [Ignelater luminosus]|uniref:Uncharacterized protein n=1 Tax=Ignelater luminosus TaxID=2038154 RepID=A0A8K0DI46_IGNLU|nr:hypothetical protein ILUMI_01626 [Ignelater luminosus]